MSNYFRSVAIAAAAIGAVSSANAATITYTDAGRGATYLSQFNPLLGTLQSAVFTSTYSFTNSYRYTDVPFGPAFTVLVQGKIGNSLVGQMTVNESVQTSKPEANQFSVSFSKNFSTTFTSNLSAYTGTGRIFATESTLTVPGYTYVSGGSFSNVSVTYTYLAGVAAVPEPATWAMMLTGLGMVAGAARYRRRKTAIALG